jgi:hypothetical protein
VNDFRFLMDYITKYMQTVQFGSGEEDRELRQYYKDKLSNPANTNKQDVRDMARRGLAVAGLSPHTTSSTPTTLSDPLVIARSAVVLAKSIIQDADATQLQAEWTRLNGVKSLASIRIELTKTLTKGDVARSQTHQRVEFKNFKSCGIKARTYTASLDRAITRLDDTINDINRGFTMASSAPNGTILAAFAKYFGSPDATIQPSTLAFGAAKDFAAPAWSAPVSHRTVVQTVLKRVLENFYGQELRFYFGGRAIDTGTYAYVSGKTKPTRIHLGGQFFTLNETGTDTQWGTLVHEATHTFARTRDHAYGQSGCRNLVKNSELAKALTNAESYQLFVEEGFP